MSNRYQDITLLFNESKQRVVIASGQAVVLHGLAIMSKDCDWILREDIESFDFILKKLSDMGATYRFGAPLDLAWHRQGWSSHFEIKESKLRLRLDFFSRPPRLSNQDLAELWSSLSNNNRMPYIDKKLLIKQKLTDRLKDYAVIGEIARSMHDPVSQLQYSQSADDILRIINLDKSLLSKLTELRPLMLDIDFNSDQVELDVRIAIEKERYKLMKENLARIENYRSASLIWADRWREINKELVELPLIKAHEILVEQANKYLPKVV